MPSNTQNVKMGVCHISFGGEDLGYTKGGVDVTVATETKPIEVDQFGNEPINEIITGRTCKVKVPLAETTLHNLVRIMPGAVLNSVGGTAGTGTITLSTAQPADGDTVTINGSVLTFKTTPTKNDQVACGASFSAAATNLAAAINGSDDPNINGFVTATVLSGAVTLTAVVAGTYEDITLAKNFATSANCTIVNMAGGVDPTAMNVVVPTAVGTSLLALAKPLVIHPMANAVGDQSDDFTIPLAMTPGAMAFAYKLDQERIYDCEFVAYPNSLTSELFYVGSKAAGGV